MKKSPWNNSSWLEFSTYSNIQGAVGGVDEVGRGALFGPVVAAAVILPVEALSILMIDDIKDSKKLSSSRRTKLAQKITTLALDWRIGYATTMAKVWRDDLVQRLALKYPLYDLENNKGYGSQRHLLALQKYGSSPLHRLSFRPCQTTLDLGL